MLMPPGPLAWNPAWAPGGAIRLGETMASEPALVAPATPA
jgi:phosphatidylserine decarboxylase